MPKLEDAEALPLIVRLSPLPVIADIHFNASLALKAIEAGVAAVRINPGNIGGDDKVAEVVAAAKKAGIPMRIGANSGSLPKHLEELAQEDQAEALVEAALEEVRLLEKLDYRDFKISVKSSHVPTMIRAYRMLSARVPYPLHLGVTEAGPPSTGAIKSAIGLGALLADGIGDTIRVEPHGRPGRGGQGRVRDPQVARPARARPDPDRLPELRPRQRRRAEARRGGRGAARARTPSTSRSRCSAAPSTARASRATPTSASRAAATSASSTPTARC